MKKSTEGKLLLRGFACLVLFVYAVNFFFNDVSEGFGINFDAFGGCGGFVREGVERRLLAFQDVHKAFIDGVFTKKTIDKHIAGLPHAVRTGNGLILDRRFELRFADNHNTGGLDVQPGAAGLDLCGKNRSGRSFFKFVDNFLAVAWRNRAVYGLNSFIAE